MSTWYNFDRSLILASASPRRKDILQWMGLNYTIIKPGVEDEQCYIQQNAIEQSIQTLARVKAESVAQYHEESLVLGCDTIVVIDNCIIGKPKDHIDAETMLQRLSGRMHTVYSGVALLCKKIRFVQTAVAQTDVFFRDIVADELRDYLKEEEYTDKAGAYAIQGKAMNFISKINGCFYNVMGLPVQETIAIFKAYKEFSKGSNNV